MVRRVILLVIFLVVMVLVDLFYGNVWQLLGNGDWHRGLEILQAIRLPRVVSAMVAGFDLAMVGLLLQTLFSNPLAGPYILGISSGAAFGIALEIMLLPYLGLYASYFSGILFALLGAGLVLLVILFLAGRYSLVVVIIAGVIISGIFSALINVLQYFSKPGMVKSYVLWTMASLDNAGFEQIIFLWFLSLIAFLWLMLKSGQLDGLYLGLDYARTIGIDVGRIKLRLLLISGIFTALVTATYGPVAFVGIISPHLSRVYCKSQKHGNLLVISVLFGSLILVLADILSHVFYVILPINTVLSLIGLPVLFYFLLKKKTIYNLT